MAARQMPLCCVSGAVRVLHAGRHPHCCELRALQHYVLARLPPPAAGARGPRAGFVRVAATSACPWRPMAGRDLTSTRRGHAGVRVRASSDGSGAHGTVQARVMALTGRLCIVTSLLLGYSRATKFLMVSDSLLESQSQVRITMHPPHVADVPAITPSEPWESHSVGWPITVLDISPTEKRLYYGCNELLADHSTAEYRQCLAISTDGLSWHKPALGLVLHNGSTANNILAPCNSSNTVFVDVFRAGKPGTPAAERWKALVNEAGGVHIWASPDAIHFTRIGNSSRPVLLGADTQNIGLGWNAAL